ncbi:OmpA family protein [Desulfolithobacter sp.]
MIPLPTPFSTGCALKRHSLLTIFGLLTLFLFPLPASASEPLLDATYITMADNFFILYDPSTAMSEPYRNTGMTRLEMEKEIIRRSNQSLPELNWQAGLYPHWKNGLWLHGSPMGFKPYYRLQKYDKEKYGAALEKLPVIPTGPPMLQVGLMKLEHLLGLPGRTEVFIFSDGQHSTYPDLEPDPLTQARKLAREFDVCFTIVSSARTREAKQLLADIAAVNSCSQVIDFDTVAAHPEHLLGKLYMKTSDVRFNNVLFDFDRYEIKKEYQGLLDRLGTFLNEHPSAYVVLSGFTCNIGSEAYNMRLSERRAKSVRDYLKKKFKIDVQRMLLYWYGYANPVAPNDTEAGRRKNRRVTIAIRNTGPATGPGTP